MVGLDFTAMDDTLIRYTAFLSQVLKIEKVYFVHVVKPFELPESLREELGSEPPRGEKIRHLMAGKVSEYFDANNRADVEVLLKEGDPLKELLEASAALHTDTMLVGRKLKLHGSGVLTHKLLRISKVGIIFVPEAFEPQLRRVVVSMDFSEYSILALQHVLQAAASGPDLAIICLHVYAVPTGYRTLGMSYEEFNQRMRGFAIDKYEQLLARFPALQQSGRLLLVKAEREHQEDTGELIVLEAKRARADMLVVGARGKSAAAQFILGSTTEKILRFDLDIPLAVYKKEDESHNLLDSFLSSYY